MRGRISNGIPSKGGGGGRSLEFQEGISRASSPDSAETETKTKKEDDPRILLLLLALSDERRATVGRHHLKRTRGKFKNVRGRLIVNS